MLLLLYFRTNYMQSKEEPPFGMNFLVTDQSSRCITFKHVIDDYRKTQFSRPPISEGLRGYLLREEPSEREREVYAEDGECQISPEVISTSTEPIEVQK